MRSYLADFFYRRLVLLIVDLSQHILSDFSYQFPRKGLLPSNLKRVEQSKNDKPEQQAEYHPRLNYHNIVDYLEIETLYQYGEALHDLNEKRHSVGKARQHPALLEHFPQRLLVLPPGPRQGNYQSHIKFMHVLEIVEEVDNWSKSDQPKIGQDHSSHIPASIIKNQHRQKQRKGEQYAQKRHLLTPQQRHREPVLHIQLHHRLNRRLRRGEDQRVHYHPQQQQHRDLQHQITFQVPDVAHVDLLDEGVVDGNAVWK